MVTKEFREIQELKRTKADLLNALKNLRSLVDVSNIRTSAKVVAKWEAAATMADNAIRRAEGKQECSFTGLGNNAEPLNNGRCCDTCNMTKVIPARLQFVPGSWKAVKK